MNLLKQIRDEIIDDSNNVSTILRKARVLASLLKNKEFEKWVLSELNGYSESDKEIPKYRVLQVNSIGDFSGPLGSGAKNMPIPTFNLPDYVKEFADETSIIQGIKSIETLVEGDSDSLVLNWPPEYIAVCQSKIYDQMNLYYARKVIGKNSMIQILDTVRNKLLDFVLELKGKNPEVVSEEEINNIPENDVQTAYEAHISGSYDSSQS